MTLIYISFTLLGSFGSFFIIDRVSRRKLMFGGLVAMAAVQIVLGIIVMVSLSPEANMVLIIINMFIFNLTVAPLYWVYAPELMKLDDFSRNQVIYWTLAWLNIMICYVAPVDYAFVVILCFGFVCLALACFVWCFVIETWNKPWHTKYTLMTVTPTHISE